MAHTRLLNAQARDNVQRKCCGYVVLQAAAVGASDIVQLLVEAGADVAAVDVEGLTGEWGIQLGKCVDSWPAGRKKRCYAISGSYPAKRRHEWGVQSEVTRRLSWNCSWQWRGCLHCDIQKPEACQDAATGMPKPQGTWCMFMSMALPSFVATGNID